MEEAIGADVVVIGAGIAGASAAAELAGDRRVVLLEMEEHAGHHTTGRSAAVFAEGYGNRAVRALTRASRAFLERPPPGFAEEPLLAPRGWMFVGREDQLTLLAALEEELGEGVRRLAPAEAVDRVPILRRDDLAGALWDGAARDVDVHGLHQGYLRQLRARGGTLRLSTRAVRLARAGGLWRVEAERAVFDAPVVVDAAGAWAEEVGRLAGAVPIGLVPMRRTALLVDPPPGMTVGQWPIVIDAAEQFYFKPEGGRILLSPADETPSPPCDARPDDLDVALAVDRFCRCCAVEVHHVPRKWAGLRSFVADRSPVVGWDPAADGFFWLAGQGGFGIQTAPALARLAATLLRGDPVPDDLEREGVSAAELSPGRFGPSTPPAAPP